MWLLLGGCMVAPGGVVALGGMRDCSWGGACMVQGGHILAKMKFPVFSLSFPCVTKIFPVLFLRKN